ncbi:MAG: DUF418 domain-containing protein [Nocardioides sp.]
MSESPAMTRPSAPDNPADPPSRAPVGPTADRDRSLAPDLARGSVLLFIALANVWGYLYGHQVNGAYRPTDGTGLANVVDFVVSLVVDDRSRPMFATLFGYGTWHMLRRQREAGASPQRARRLVIRRNGWLIVFGVVHAALLFEGDILGVYGVSGLVALLVWNRTRRTKIVAGSLGLFAGVAAAVVIAFLFFAPGDDVVTAGDDYLREMLSRTVGAGIGLALIAVLPVFLAPFLIGAAMAEGGLLERPWDHRPLLRRLALSCVLAGLAGGLPTALTAAGWWAPSGAVQALLHALHLVSGTACGVGYLALFGLWSARRRGADHRGFAVSALAATGKRSLSCYLMQSVILAPVLSAWGLGLGGRIGTPAAYLIAAMTWLATVAFAVLLERAGRRGPAEVVLRHLTYHGLRRPRVAPRVTH